MKRQSVRQMVLDEKKKSKKKSAKRKRLYGMQRGRSYRSRRLKIWKLKG